MVGLFNQPHDNPINVDDVADGSGGGLRVQSTCYRQ